MLLGLLHELELTDHGHHVELLLVAVEAVAAGLESAPAVKTRRCLAVAALLKHAREPQDLGRVAGRDGRDQGPQGFGGRAGDAVGRGAQHREQADLIGPPGLAGLGSREESVEDRGFTRVAAAGRRHVHGDQSLEQTLQPIELVGVHAAQEPALLLHQGGRRRDAAVGVRRLGPGRGLLRLVGEEATDARPLVGLVVVRVLVRGPAQVRQGQVPVAARAEESRGLGLAHRELTPEPPEDLARGVGVALVERAADVLEGLLQPLLPVLLVARVRHAVEGDHGTGGKDEAGRHPRNRRTPGVLLTAERLVRGESALRRPLPLPLGHEPFEVPLPRPLVARLLGDGGEALEHLGGRDPLAALQVDPSQAIQ